MSTRSKEIRCPYCRFYCRSKRGLTQHILAKAECFIQQQIALGIIPEPPPAAAVVAPPPAKLPTQRTGSVAAGRRKAPPRPPDPVDPPTSKVARLPDSSPKSPWSTKGYSDPELIVMQEQIDKHPNRTLEDWIHMAEEYAGTPEALRKSTRSGGKSASVAKTLAGILRNQEDDDEDFGGQMDDDSNEDLVDTRGTDEDISQQEAINPEGIPLNEDVLPGEEDFNNDGYLNINVNTKMRDSFKKYCEEAVGNMFPQLTKEQERGVRLLDILRRKKTSLDTYDEVMLWHLRQIGVLDEDDMLKEAGDEFISRDKLLAELTKRYNMGSKFPYVKPTVLPHAGQKIDLVCFDAWGCFESLLTDPRLTDDDFWFFDDDPFADPPESLTTITDLHTAMAHREAHKLYKKKPNQIVLPIPLYMDGANTGQMKNMPITALKMTLGIFTRKYRELDQAWRVLGHVHTVSRNQAKAKKMFTQSKHIDAGLQADEDGPNANPYKDPAGSSKDLHKMLDVILESFREVQEKGFMWDLRYRGTTYKVEFVPYVIFMKCDTQEGDMLCGSYTNRTKNVKQLCRYCLCPTEETDNPQANFGFKTVPMVKAHADAKDLAALQEISQHCIDNAFHKLRFSPINNRGIHGATPSEMLHAILLGTFQMIRDVLFEQIGDKSQMSVDFQGLAMLYGKLFGRQSERGLPKCSFNSGIREGKLNAKEYRGILLVIAAVFRCTEGRKKLAAYGFTQQRIQDWLECLEIVLAWEAFLNQDAMTKVHVAKLSHKHRYLMWMIKKVAARKTGMGMKLMKYHAITHLAQDIILFGVPLEVDTGANESGHKATKVAARSTQKNEKTFDIQTATRLVEHHVLDMAMQELDGCELWKYYTKSETTLPEPFEPADKIVTGGTIINVFEDDNDEPCYSIGRGPQAKVPSDVNWDPDIVKFLHQCQEKLRVWTKSPMYKLQICSEQTRNGQIFRGHPVYRKDNHWRDWVMIDWGRGDPEPAQIWCFIDLNGIPKPTAKSKLVHGNCDLKPGVFAVVECADLCGARKNEPKSCLFLPVVKEMRNTGEGLLRARRFYLVDTEAIADPAFVIPDVGSEKAYFQVKSREDWVLVFEDWLDKPFPDAYKNDKEGLHL